MNAQEQQLIESLFGRLSQGIGQAGPRDPQAEALIQQKMQAMPGAGYYMAQTILMQERALQEAQQRLANQPGGGSTFSGPIYGGQPGYGPQPAYGYGQQQGGIFGQPGQGGSGLGGFMGGAAKLALGIGGGILLGDVAMHVANGIFGQGWHEGQGGYDQGYDAGLQAGEDRGDQGQNQGQQGFFDSGNQGFDTSGNQGYDTSVNQGFDQSGGQGFDTSGDSGDWNDSGSDSGGDFGDSGGGDSGW
jgi:uncharacterized protein